MTIKAVIAHSIHVYLLSHYRAWNTIIKIKIKIQIV